MEYGNNLKHVVWAVKFGGALGVLVVLASIVGITIEGRWAVSRPLVLPLLLVLPAAILIVMIGPTACFRIRVRGNNVEFVFLKKFVLRRCPLQDFAGTEERFSGTHLVFANGKGIPIPAMHRDEQRRMLHDLEKLHTAAKWGKVPGCIHPPHSVAVEPEWLAWNDGLIPKLAQAIAEENAFDRLPILADALEEAGCTDEEILAHCRDKGAHVRGCWVVALFLARHSLPRE
jgi:hypothetical protein